VYGLMALGLSVIFRVVRVVNFAHGEMMTIAMYAATCSSRCSSSSLPPPCCRSRGVLRPSLRLQRAHQPLHHAPSTRKFMLLGRVAIILVNRMLMIFAPTRRQRPGRLPSSESYELGPIRVDKARLFAAAGRVSPLALFSFFPLHAPRQGDPRLRRQPISAPRSSA